MQSRKGSPAGKAGPGCGDRSEVLTIRPADAAHLSLVRRFLEEYWNSFGFTPCFQHFGEKLAGLPGCYAPPKGRLAVAFVHGEAAGCVALRRWDEERCEAKRLYVRPVFRGRGIGRALLAWVAAQARAAGYREMLGDTMPVMERALAMYQGFGFERTAPYAEDPTPGAIFLRLRLERS